MNIRKSLLPIVLALPLAMVGSLTPRTGWAELDIAEVPLFAASVVEPNIQFILDDSGSMLWSYMPDGINSDRTTKRAKSSAYNTIYYNPEVTYALPLDEDGDPLAEPNFESAWMDGYKHNRGDYTPTVNLSKFFRPTWRYFYGSGSSYAASAQQAFYYVYDDEGCGDKNNDSCYDKVIVSNTSGPGGTDERQNFANWYSYYQTREMLAKAGISSAFHQQGNRVRVGYGAINSGAVTRGVRTFEGGDRSQFLQWLINFETPKSNTPLRTALKAVGEYYKTKEPWRTDPEDTSEKWSDMLACRQSYAILMTDGYWNGSDPSSVGDVDKDGYSNTLADVARKYWDTDLISQLDNNVPLEHNQRQHMVTFGVGLGVTGTITDTDAALEWAPNDSRWPDPESADPHKIDDLLHAAANSHGGFFSASDPQTFADELARTLGKIATAAGAAFGLTSSGIVQKIGGLGFQVDTDTGNWTSEIYGIVNPGTSGERIKWRASNKMPAHSSRKLFTNTGTSGAAFNGTVGGLDASLVSYIRGDSALEGTTYQKRDSLVGAVVGSQPFLQRQVNYDWTRLPAAQGGGKTYEDYVEGKASKPSVLYAGSNAGVLHAFNAQSGREMFGYVPRAVWGRLSDLADPDVPFRFTVDGEVVVTDVYNGSAWKTVLVGGLGAGGKGIYALDVTNPGSFGASNVMWEVTADDLASDSKADPENLGFTFAKPQVARLKNGNWAVVVGNGYGADDHQARLLVFDLFSGKVIGNIQAGNSGTQNNPNGLSSPRVVRERPEETHDRWVYAGDLHGNLWRFDLNSIGSTSSIISKPFFSGAKNGNRPITAQPQTSYPGAAGFAVSFGTGKFFEADDSLVDDSSPYEYFFFIYDNNPAGTAPGHDLNDLANRSFTGATTGEQDEIEVGGNEKGWYVKFQDRGERLLSQPRVLPGGLGMVTFTSFVPTQDRCEPGGDNWLYLLRTESGQGALVGESLDGTDYADFAGRDGGIKGPPTQPVQRVKPPITDDDDDIVKPPQVCISVGDREICLDSDELQEAAMDMYYGRRANWIQVR